MRASRSISSSPGSARATTARACTGAAAGTTSPSSSSAATLTTSSASRSRLAEHAMIALWITILGSSLAGSLHCVAMCGPLVGLSASKQSLSLALVHALGRLTTYAALGALAGAVGGAVDLAGHLAAVQHGAAIVAGAAIVGWGLREIAVARGRRSAGPARGGALFQRGL